MSPSLSLGRYGQPLCGAVLDDKYLLIGTTFGLDFLPLRRVGNKSARSGLFERFAGVSSSSASTATLHHPTLPEGIPFVPSPRDIKTRKPISLIKKTRFKQLVVLSERSNVLLAVAGRNDHVRVYALDSLSALIERKMKEIEDKEGPQRPTPSRSHKSEGSTHRTGGLQSLPPPVPPLPSSVKGKGKARAVNSPAPLQLQGEASSRQTMSSSSMQSSTQSTVRSPPPTYGASTVSPHDASQAASALPLRRRSSASSGPPTPRYRPRTYSSPLQPPHDQESKTSTPSEQSVARGKGQRTNTSPRSPKRMKSREVIRRSSNTGVNSSSGESQQSMSRRGSAATVIANPHGNASKDAKHTPSSRLAARKKRSQSISRGGAIGGASNAAGTSNSSSQTNLLGDGLLDSADDDELVHAASGFDQGEHGEDSDSLEERGAASRYQARRMRPRAPVAKDESETSDSEQISQLSPEDNGPASDRAKKASKRVSLADILKESPSSRPVTVRRTVSTDHSSTSMGVIKPEPRSAIGSSSIEQTRLLADFLRDGPTLSSAALSTSSDYDEKLHTMSSVGHNLTRQASITQSVASSAVTARFQPRSPTLHLQSASAATNDLLEFLNSESPMSHSQMHRPRASSPPLAAGPQSSHASQDAMLPSASRPIGDASQRGARQRTPSAPEAPFSTAGTHQAKAAKRMSLQPHSAGLSGTHRTEEADSGLGSTLSLHQALVLDQPSSDTVPEFNTAAHSAAPWSRSQTGPSSGQVSATEDALRRKKRNRWSLLEGLRGSSNNASTAAIPPQPSASSLASSSTDRTFGMSRTDSPLSSESMPGRRLHQHTSSMASNISLPAPSTQAGVPSTTSSSAPGPSIPLLKPRPVADDDRPPFPSLHSENEQVLPNPEGTTITFTQTGTSGTGNQPANGSRAGPSSLNGGAASNVNLEYVKLAKTKGSRFIRASETRKRTYLAVLCGEAGERIELFTVRRAGCGRQWPVVLTWRRD